MVRLSIFGQRRIRRGWCLRRLPLFHWRHSEVGFCVELAPKASARRNSRRGRLGRRCNHRGGSIMSAKQLVLETVRQMSDKATMEQIVERLAILAAIRRGE